MATGAQESRFQFALSTGNGSAGSNSEYYDQSIAISQALINKSFRELFQNTEGVARIIHSNKDAGDRIFGDLDAPTIMLIGHTDDENLAYYQFRIKAANVVFRNGQTRTLSNWTLSIKVNLAEVSLDIHPEDDEATRKNKEYWKQDLLRRYPGFVIGDYRVQRIFANFSAGQWKNPVEERSTCFDPKSKRIITLQEWKAQPENSDYFYRIMNLIGEWAKVQAHEGLSTLGIKISLHEENEDQLRPVTFRPMLRHTQVYPYKSQNCPNATTSIGDFSHMTQTEPYGDLVHGDYNCLMFCENVDTSWGMPGKSIDSVVRPLPQVKKMSHSYNLAFPVSDDIPKVPDSLGTFAMDHRVVMDRYLLPTLEELCLQSWMKIREPDREIAAPHISFHPHYSYGGPYPLRELNMPPTRDVKFLKISDGHYRWQQGNNKGEQGHRFTDGPYSLHRDRYNSYQIDSESAVEVKWAPGQSAMVISVFISYKYDCSFADNQDMTGQVDRVKYQIIAEAIFSLELQVLDTVIVPSFKGLSSRNATNPESGSSSTSVNSPSISRSDMKVTTKYFDVTSVTGQARDNTHSVTQKNIERDLWSSILGFTEKVNKHFSSSGNLVLPGYGSLEVKNPKFTKLGGIVADLVFKSTLSNEVISFPRPRQTPALRDETPGQQKPITGVPEQRDENNLKLNWDYQVSYNPRTKVCRLSLRALNNKKEDLSFHFIRVSLLRSTSTKTRLFDDTEWSKAPDAKALDVLFTDREYTYVDSNSGDYSLETTLQGNVYQLSKSKSWPANSPALEVKVKTDRSVGEMQASVQGLKRSDFKVPREQVLTLELQGDIRVLGNYRIKIAESW